MKRFIAEPLVQFLLLGLLLFFALQFFAPQALEADGANKIEVSDSALIEYLQYQRKSFNPEKAELLLSTMAEQERDFLVTNYVRDEALFREAMSLGLNDNDEIIRRRLIQKMEYIAQGFYDEVPALSEVELQEYFKENSAQYAVAASLTFTHVYLAADTNQEAVSAKAGLLLNELNAESVPFEKAGQYGERFLYNLNYVERTEDYVANHFGKSFAAEMFGLKAAEQWQGPIKSEYGEHLVLIKAMTGARLPSLEETSGIVLADAQREQQRKLKAKAISELVEKYQVVETK